VLARYELSPTEIAFGFLIVGGLAALSLYYARRQLALLRGLRGQSGPLDEEALYERRKARGRLLSCVLAVVLAVLLGVLVGCWNSTIAPSARERQADPAAGQTPEQRLLIRTWGGLCIAILVDMLVLLVLAALDVWATRRFAIAQYRKISEDRRAMIRGEVDRLRAQREAES
jgi:hypothetical protein